MRTPTPLRLTTCITALLLTCIPGILIAEPKNIISQIEGDTHCVKSAQRHYFMWSRYDDTKADLVSRGQDHSQEAMWGEADKERPVLWRTRVGRRNVIAIKTGDVFFNQPTKFGSFPNFGDINVGYNLDWRVKGYYSWASGFQPRTESVTEIVIKEGFEATIEFTNSIDMFANGFISGNHDENSDPWPQQARHNQQLRAIDINGNSHGMKVIASSTAAPQTSRGSSQGNSVGRSWTVSGGATISKSGPSVNVGGSVGGSSTYSESSSRSIQVPTVFDVNYTESSKSTIVKKVIVKCDDPRTVKVSRSAQISGDFLTRSLAGRGSVRNKSTNSVLNTLKIKITCKPCENPSPPVVPPETPDPSDREEPTPEKPDPRYGKPCPDCPFDPRDRKHWVITPRGSDLKHSNSLPGNGRPLGNNPGIRGSGTIFVTADNLPDYFRTFTASEMASPDFDPTIFDSLEANGQVPFLLPEGGVSAQELEGDFNGDGTKEKVKQDPDLPAGAVDQLDSNGDGKTDSLSTGDKPVGQGNADNDKNDTEYFLQSENTIPNGFSLTDLDQDGDWDLMTIGKGYRLIGVIPDPENPGKDDIFIQCEQKGSKAEWDLDGDGELDVFIVPAQVPIGFLKDGARLDAASDATVFWVTPDSGNGGSITATGAVFLTGNGGVRDLFPNGMEIKFAPGGDIQLNGTVRVEPTTSSRLEQKILTGPDGARTTVYLTRSADQTDANGIGWPNGLVHVGDNGRYIFSPMLEGVGEWGSTQQVPNLLEIDSIIVDDNHFHMRVKIDPPETKYQIERSDNLENWDPIPENIVASESINLGVTSYTVDRKKGADDDEGLGETAFIKASTVLENLDPADRTEQETSILEGRILQGISDRYGDLVPSRQDKNLLNDTMSSILNHPEWVQWGWSAGDNPEHLAQLASLIPVIGDVNAAMGHATSNYDAMRNRLEHGPGLIDSDPLNTAVGLERELLGYNDVLAVMLGDLYQLINVWEEMLQQQDADTDGDGLPNWVETNTGRFVDPRNTGTDPDNPDSDGDGFPDGVEVQFGSDPNNPRSIPRIDGGGGDIGIGIQ